MEKKTDCVFYNVIVDSYPRQTGENSFILDYELADEVCSVDSDNPKHHDEYDCKDCPFYKRNNDGAQVIC